LGTRSAKKMKQRGSITLIQAALVMALGLVFVLAVAGLQKALGGAAVRDKCLIEAAGKSIDLADPTLDVAKACKKTPATPASEGTPLPSP